MYPNQRITSVQLFLYYGKALLRVFQICCTKKGDIYKAKQNKLKIIRHLATLF